MVVNTIPTSVPACTVLALPVHRGSSWDRLQAPCNPAYDKLYTWIMFMPNTCMFLSDMSSNYKKKKELQKKEIAN